MPYTIVIERDPTSWGASVKELPGCVAVAETEAEVRKLIQLAIIDHLTDDDVDAQERGEA